MLDLAFVRGNLPLVEEKLRSRGGNAAAAFDDFQKLDLDRRRAITEAEELKAQRNALSAEVGNLKRAGQDASVIMARTMALKEQTEKAEDDAKAASLQMLALLLEVPNLPSADVPVGKSETDNIEVLAWGEKPVFAFEPKPHWDLGEALGILDMQRGAKISGARFPVYWRAGARLERALANLMLDVHTSEHGYEEVLPPSVVNKESLFGTGQLPKFRNDLFRCVQQIDELHENPEGDAPNKVEEKFTLGDHWLIPTAEVPVTNLYRDEVLDDAQLPISLVAYTPCFRAEAGSHGRDVRGIIRVHQFQKVELVKFARPEDSQAEHERLTGHAESILQRLKLPYRKVLLCTGDMGFSAAKTYDLEVWLPGQGLYREISSCSNFGDFQARRANIKYRPAGKTKGEFLHTLNGSGLAIGRTWLAILENYQQADGSVRIPDVLLPYMGGESVIQVPENRPAKTTGNGKT
jgi:seryl-tRNA synthetase